MSLVKNKEVINYFKENNIQPKEECKCVWQAQIKHCRNNCTNISFHKINYK